MGDGESWTRLMAYWHRRNMENWRVRKDEWHRRNMEDEYYFLMQNLICECRIFEGFFF